MCELTHVVAGERHGRDMGTACYVWIGLKATGARHDTTRPSGQTPDKEVEIKNITVYVSGYTVINTTGMLFPRLSGANKVSLFRVDGLARYLLQCVWDSSVVVMDRTYLIELVRDMRPLWDQRDKNYYNRDLKPKLWDEIGEKLNVTGKYWNNNLITYSMEQNPSWEVNQ